MTKYVNTCKISNFLPYCQSSNPEPILNYNTTNFLDLLLDNYKENISSRGWNNGKKEIKKADMDSDKKNIRPANIDKQKLITSN